MTQSPLAEIPNGTDLVAPDTRATVLDNVESGRIVLLHGLAFELTARERELIQDTAVILPGQKERDSRIGRPTLILDPVRGTIERTNIRGEARREIEAMMQRFSQWAERTIAT